MNRLIFLAFLTLFAFTCPTAVLSQENPQTEWTSFDFYDDQYIFVRGTVNGHETDMMVDTGAETSIIDKSFARRYDVPKGKRINMSGVGGRKKAYWAKNIEVVIDNFQIRATKVAIIDLSAIHAAIDRPIAFILGVESFMRAVVDIDYPNRRIAFRSAEDFNYDGPGRTVEVKLLKRGRRAIEASVEGREPAWYLIDTGSSYTADIFPSLAGRQRLLDNRAPTSEWVSGGIGGLIREVTASVKGFSVGGFELKDMPVAIPAASAGPLTRDDFEGIMATEF